MDSFILGTVIERKTNVGLKTFIESNLFYIIRMQRLYISRINVVIWSVIKSSKL